MLGETNGEDIFGLSGLELVAFDFDNTIWIHDKHNYSHEEDIELYTNILRGYNPYSEKNFNKITKYIMNECSRLGIRMALCSHTLLIEEANIKISTIERVYGYRLINLCVGQARTKHYALEAAANAYGIPKHKILLVDDLWENTELAEQAGFKTTTVSKMYKLLEDRSSC